MCCVIFYVKWHDLRREEQQKYYEKDRSAHQLHMEYLGNSLRIAGE